MVKVSYYLRFGDWGW